jgi:hypothetical protein
MKVSLLEESFAINWDSDNVGRQQILHCGVMSVLCPHKLRLATKTGANLQNEKSGPMWNGRLAHVSAEYLPSRQHQEGRSACREVQLVDNRRANS